MHRALRSPNSARGEQHSEGYVPADDKVLTVTTKGFDGVAHYTRYSKRMSPSAAPTVTAPPKLSHRPGRHMSPSPDVGVLAGSGVFSKEGSAQVEKDPWAETKFQRSRPLPSALAKGAPLNIFY